ncbi:MAG: acetate--CoA ligase family protein, partial [Anaerolineae bacterium]
SIAIVGISPRPGNLGQGVLLNLNEHGYRGQVYLVGRGGGQVGGLPVRQSVDELPEGIDLAVILTPAPTVPAYLDACGQRGIRRACIESSGFGEFSAGGPALQAQVVEVARQRGIRFTGPNGLGVINLADGVCVPFAPMTRDWVRRGRVSILAQSGGLIQHACSLLAAAGMGINKGVSLGNKADLNEADFLEYLLDDDDTDIIWLYLEGFSDGRRLLELAHSSPKPILMLKAGRGPASGQILQSHAAALASDDRVVDAAAWQVGILRVNDFREMVTLTKAFALPPVQGDDLLVFSRSGGTAVMAADAAEAHGFRLIEVPPSFADKIRQHNRADVIVPTNPVDLGAMFDLDAWVSLLEEGIATLRPHAAVMSYIYTPSWEGEVAQRLAEALRDLGRRIGIPLAVVPTAKVEEIDALERSLGYPVFREIGDALRALAASRDWQRKRTLNSQDPMPKATNTHHASRITHRVSRITPHPLLEPPTLDKALQLVEAYGIPTAAWATARDVEAALAAADRLGYPLALKVISAGISHKTDVGGIALDVADGAALRRSWTAMQDRLRARALGAAIEGFLVQKMVSGGRELILGARRDPNFGPVVLFGLGGIYVEVLDDVSLRVAPLTRHDAEEMIAELRGSRLLRGARGQAPADVGALVEALLALSRLMLEHPEIAELDINPLVVLEKGALALDARIVVGPTAFPKA